MTPGQHARYLAEHHGLTDEQRIAVEGVITTAVQVERYHVVLAVEETCGRTAAGAVLAKVRKPAAAPLESAA